MGLRKPVQIGVGPFKDVPEHPAHVVGTGEAFENGSGLGLFVRRCENIFDGDSASCERGYLPRPYRGVTETVATWVADGLPTGSSANATITDSGIDGAPITFSGGWDRTSMTTQSGISYFQGRHYWSYPVYYSGKSWLVIEKVGAFNMTSAAVVSAGGSSIVLDLEQAVGCTMGAFRGSSLDTQTQRIKFSYIQGAMGDALLFNIATAYQQVRQTLKGKRVHGTTGTNATSVLSISQGTLNQIDRVDNNGCIGLNNSRVVVDSGVSDLIGTVFANNLYEDVQLKGTACGSLRLSNCSFTIVPGDLAGDRAANLYSTRENGVATAHSLRNRYYWATSETVVRHTPSGLAWKLCPLSVECLAGAPAFLSLAKIACVGGALATVKCWMRRDNTALSAALRLVPSDLAGDVFAVNETRMTAPANVWEEVTLTFTPSATGVVEIEGVAWGGTTYSAYFDDLSVS